MTSELVIGWAVNKTREPVYWLAASARPGAQEPADLVTVPSAALAAHTAVIAQSGSGKSFLVGRLIEELVLRTRARVVVLDPNADFARLGEVEPSALWETARYDPARKLGVLPHEATREAFAEDWPTPRIQTLTGTPGVGRPLTLFWSRVSIELVAQEVDPSLLSELRHCHAFVGAAEEALCLQAQARGDPLPAARDVLARAEWFLRQARMEPVGFRRSLEREFGALDVGEGVVPEADAGHEGGAAVIDLRHEGLLDVQPAEARAQLEQRGQSLVERLVGSSEHVREHAHHYYFSRAGEFEADGILANPSDRAAHDQGTQARVTVVDLPSLRTRESGLLAVEAVVREVWDGASVEWRAALAKPAIEDCRVPTFVVVDEAHNLIPAEARGGDEEILRERFRTVVAEGRKYGVFLILVSQRPDKIDPSVLSECENKAIMHISTQSVLQLTKSRLGLEDVHDKLLAQCLDFETGRVLLQGGWTDEPRIAYCAARRTVQGGRNLRAEHWAQPEPKTT